MNNVAVWVMLFSNSDSKCGEKIPGPLSQLEGGQGAAARVGTCHMFHLKID